MYYSQNNIGSTTLLTNKDGSDIGEFLYTPFGETWVEEASTVDISHITRFFTNQQYDKESGLYYYNARYYDPHLGSFITPDPAMDGINHYAYCRSNPIKYTDPTGLFVVKFLTKLFFPNKSKKVEPLVKIADKMFSQKGATGLTAKYMDQKKFQASQIYTNAKSDYDKALSKYKATLYGLLASVYAKKASDVATKNSKNKYPFINDNLIEKTKDHMNDLDTISKEMGIEDGIKLTPEKALDDYKAASQELLDILNDPTKNPFYEEGKEWKPSELEYEHDYDNDDDDSNDDDSNDDDDDDDITID